MKRLTVVLLVALLALMAAVPAQAGKPVEGSRDWEDDWIEVNCADYGPYDFEVWDHITVHESWSDQFDKAGNWIKSEWSAKGTDHVYNRSHPDRFAEGNFHSTGHSKPAPGEPGWVIGTYTGLFWNIELPGAGTVYHRSGLLQEKWYGDYGNQLIEIKRSGLDREDFETLCEALK